MNVTEYIYLLNKPDAIFDRQILGLEQILQDFPYFQSARSLYIKGLFKQKSFKYNNALKTTAAYTTDRSVLFELITLDSFTCIQKVFFERKKAELLDIKVIDSIVIKAAIRHDNNTIEKSILSSIKESNQDQIIEKEEPIFQDKLELGKPIPFNPSETHSFQEWLQLSKVKPIIRVENIESNRITENNLSSKLDVIDKFIEANPKIPPIKKDSLPPVFAVKKEDHSYLMTETLAKVYLEQKKYSKAIQAYEILILKYPEKFTFFADRISDIKSLQHNNN